MREPEEQRSGPRQRRPLPCSSLRPCPGPITHQVPVGRPYGTWQYPRQQSSSSSQLSSCRPISAPLGRLPAPHCGRGAGQAGRWLHFGPEAFRARLQASRQTGCEQTPAQAGQASSSRRSRPAAWCPRMSRRSSSRRRPPTVRRPAGSCAGGRGGGGAAAVRSGACCERRGAGIRVPMVQGDGRSCGVGDGGALRYRSNKAGTPAVPLPPKLGRVKQRPHGARRVQAVKVAGLRRVARAGRPLLEVQRDGRRRRWARRRARRARRRARRRRRGAAAQSEGAAADDASVS